MAEELAGIPQEAGYIPADRLADRIGCCLPGFGTFLYINKNQAIQFSQDSLKLINFYFQSFSGSVPVGNLLSREEDSFGRLILQSYGDRAKKT